jgi:alanine racemase
MNRLGFDLSEMAKLREVLSSSPNVRVEGVCTHLSHGEEIDQAQGISQQQLHRFNEMAKDLPGVRHAHKSASLATLARKGLKKNDNLGARPGITLYFLTFDEDLSGPGLRPALRWKSALVRVHQVQKGEGVSYGARWIAENPATIGVVPVGYGDGYLRAYSNRAKMLFRGAQVPVVGSVCMDYTLVDLSNVCRDQPAQPGEEIVMLGQQGNAEVSAATLAAIAGTITYEVVTGIRRRVRREAL